MVTQQLIEDDVLGLGDGMGREVGGPVKLRCQDPGSS
jgi:hypothetical protein